MKWITKKLMQHQLKKAQKAQYKHDNLIVKQAYEDMIRSYKSTISFLTVQ